MNNNTQNEQFDFEEKRESYILRDTLDVINANWYWFVDSVVVFTLVGYYYSSSRPFLYSKEATIIIKDEKKNGMSPELAAFADVGMGMQSTDVESEVYILKSKYLMARVVERLGLNITYMQKNGLRYIDVYTKTPVILNLVGDVTAGSFGMDITPINVNEASVVYPIKKGELKTQKVNFGDTIATPYFTFVITKGVPFTNSSIDVPVYVNYENTTRSENRYSRKVTVNRADKVTAFVSLSIKDGNAKRAEDILNAMVEMYNIDAIQNKNLIAQNTEDFIVERLSNIKGELGDVDTEVETFKKDNNITDLTQVSSMALTIGETIQKEVVDIEMQKNIVNFFIEYL
ncbi:MAG: hypothetical protein RR257_06565, partial [Rikenellaceae bacterium]